MTTKTGESAGLEYPRLVHKPPTTKDGLGEHKRVESAEEYDAALAAGWERHARGWGVSVEDAAATDAANQVDADLLAARKREDTERIGKRATEDAARVEARRKADAEAAAAKVKTDAAKAAAQVKK